MRSALATVFVPALILALGIGPVALAQTTASIAPAPSAEAQTDAPFRLIMVEQPGCAYCARWNAELAEIYPKTPEGKLAPLERVQLRAPLPEGLSLRSAPVFTPTFVLVQNGIEVGRIEGYPGQDFFWGLLGMALREAGADLPAPG
ncbi:MAG: hypothetical protein PHX82_02875 [Paracoccaceae bacterium]|jgi:hypothetical protein|nr:hypothetical protein [Paracoccaceae bacterium]